MKFQSSLISESKTYKHSTYKESLWLAGNHLSQNSSTSILYVTVTRNSFLDFGVPLGNIRKSAYVICKDLKRDETTISKFWPYRCSDAGVLTCLKNVRLKKSKAIPITGCGWLHACEMLRIPHCLDNRLTDGGKVVSPMYQPHFTPQKHYYFSVSGTHFC
jgi:hypothetical protein